MKTIPVIIRVTALLIIFILMDCKHTKREAMFWISSDNKTVIDINYKTNMCNFYYSGIPNSYIFNMQYFGENNIKLICHNIWCTTFIKKNEANINITKFGTELEMIYPSYKKLFNPYYNEIHWDSIIISTGYIENSKYHSTLMNDSIDKTNKSILAWIIQQDSFDLPNVPDNYGDQSAIFLKLYSKEKVIADKRANLLFVDMHWENAIVF